MAISTLDPASIYGTNQTQKQNQYQSGTSTGTSSNATTQLTQQNAATNGQQMNVYGDAQKQLQNNLPGVLSSFLQSGNLPGSFGVPQQVVDAYQQNFDRFIAPKLATQYGAGSPTMGSQNTLGLQQLLANLYQTQSGNFNNVLNTASGVAFNPLGSQQAQTQTTNTNQFGTSNTADRNAWQSNNTALGAMVSGGQYFL